VVTRVLGAEATVQVDTFWLQAQDGDLILLCSDGLTDMVSEDEFARVLAKPGDCDTIAHELVAAALAGGGEDNVTVVLFRIGEREGAEAAAPRQVLMSAPALEPEDDGARRSARRTLMWVVATLAVVGALGAG